MNIILLYNFAHSRITDKMCFSTNSAVNLQDLTAFGEHLMMLGRFLQCIARKCSVVADVCNSFILRVTDSFSFQQPRDQVQAILKTEAVLAYDTSEHSFNLWCRNPKKFREFINIAT